MYITLVATTMPAQLCRCTDQPQSNQFIRPTSTIVTIDTVSAAGRLVSRGSGFKTSDEVATAIASGIAAELADALMVALGPRFESLSSEDVTVIFELYEATPSVAATADAVEVPEASDAVVEQ